MDKQECLNKFREFQAKLASLQYALGLIGWDASTEAPKKSAAYRAKVTGQLSGEAFSLQLAPETISILEQLAGTNDLDPATRKSVELYLKEVDRYRKVPKAEFVQFMELRSMAERVWEEAKAQSDFAMFAPYLEKLVDFSRRYAEYRGYVGHPYNTLLDDYEEGMTIEKYDRFFGALKADLVPFVQQVHTEGRKIDDSVLYKYYPKNIQRQFVEYLMGVLHFDRQAGVLKESVHPFTTGGSPNDIRFTVRYLEKYLPSSVFAGMHEMGHAIYGQQIDLAYEGTNLSEGASSGIHESQSRFYENVIGRSRAFWQVHYPKLQELFPENLKDVSLEDFYRAINRSVPSLIRIEADELTYALHIIIRYEMERDIFSGRVEVKDLPGIWNDKYEAYLGIRPANDAEGILQDVHWSGAMFGYFPTYALGTAYAAQILDAMERDFSVEQAVLDNRIDKVNGWLKEKIHHHGALYTPEEVLHRATGSAFDPQYYICYLKEKYTPIYF